MATDSTSTIHLPTPLADAAAASARAAGVSLEEFIASAIEAKLHEDEFLRRRRGRPDWRRFDEIMDREGGEEPRPDDVLPPGVERTYLTKKRPSKKA